MLTRILSPLLFRQALKTNVINRYLATPSSHPIECKVALITGGSIGIGYEFAKSLLASGARAVMLGDIREKEGQDAVCQLTQKFGPKTACFMKCDVTKDNEFEDLFKATMENFKQLDIVINNAGLLQDKNWSLEIDVNVKGVVRGTLLGFDYMGRHKKGRGGVIVNVASVYGLQQAHGCPVYNGTKGFVIRFSDAMSHCYYENKTDVKVMTLCPGVTDTNMITESSFHGLEGFGEVGKMLSEALASLPSQPASACGDCLIQMLCDNENGRITVIEACDCYKVKLPDRHTLRA